MISPVLEPPPGPLTTTPFPPAATCRLSPGDTAARCAPDGSVTASPASPLITADTAPTARPTRTSGSDPWLAGCSGAGAPGPAAGVQLPIVSPAAAAARNAAPHGRSRPPGNAASAAVVAKVELDSEVLGLERGDHGLQLVAR